MSQLEALCNGRPKVGIACTYLDCSAMPGDSQPMNHYRVTLTYRGRKLTTDFRTGLGWTREPNAADVLSSLILDASSGDEEDFEAFCSSFGYDSDSRKAEQIWNACRKMAPKLRRFLGDDFEKFAQAEH